MAISCERGTPVRDGPRYYDRIAGTTVPRRARLKSNKEREAAGYEPFEREAYLAFEREKERRKKYLLGGGGRLRVSGKRWGDETDLIWHNASIKRF